MNIGHCVLSHQIIKRKDQTWFLWVCGAEVFRRAALIQGFTVYILLLVLDFFMSNSVELFIPIVGIATKICRCLGNE